jgi:hypothetical protein
MIQVLAGMYRENVVVPAGKDGLQILGGNAKTVIVDAQPAAPNGTGPGFEVESNAVTITNLTVRHAAAGGATGEGDGIRCIANGCRIQGVVLINNGGAGIEINGNDAVVTGCRFTANEDRGLVLVGDNAQILKNLVQNQDEGGYDLSGNNLLVEGNSADIIEDGLGFFVNGSNNRVRKNNASITAEGGFSISGDKSVIEKNRACPLPVGEGIPAPNAKIRAEQYRLPSQAEPGTEQGLFLSSPSTGIRVNCAQRS